MIHLAEVVVQAPAEDVALDDVWLGATKVVAGRLLTVFQEVQDQHGVAETLDLLGVASYLSGDLVQSVAYYRQVVTLFREMDNRQGLVSSLATLLLCGDSYDSTTLATVTTSAAEVRRVGEQALTILFLRNIERVEIAALPSLDRELGGFGRGTLPLRCDHDR